MRSMMQLLGGVAVAGVVAAGSTAFTAAGLTSSLTGGVGLVGGTVSLTSSSLDGVQVDKLVMLSSQTDKSKIDGATVSLSAVTGTLNTTTSIVSVIVTGNYDGGGSAALPMTCTFNSGVKWDCTAGAHYATTVTAVAVSVQAGV
jgi:hypothetical protein